MADNSEKLKKLIEEFINYRKILEPLQAGMKSIGDMYLEIRRRLEEVTNAFSKKNLNQLDEIGKKLAAQAETTKTFTSMLDEFSAGGEKYAQGVNEVIERFKDVGAKLETVNEIERNAEELMRKLDGIIEEKRSSYDLKDLRKSLDSYNKNVERISEYINKDIAQVLADNGEKIEAIRARNEELSGMVSAQAETMAELISAFKGTSALLRTLVENDAVNKEYLFDALDAWASERRIKTKKK